jgi:hypothetical protein
LSPEDYLLEDRQDAKENRGNFALVMGVLRSNS